MAALLGISPDTSTVQAGAVAKPPDPCDVKNSLVVVILPGKRAAVGVAFSYIMSPSVVIGLKASKAALAVVCPVPPLAIATTPVTFAAFPAILPVT